MFGIIGSFFQKNLLVIAGWAAAALAVAAVLLGARSAGRKAEQVDQLKRTLKSVEQSNAIEREIDDSYRRNGGPPNELQRFYLD